MRLHQLQHTDLSVHPSAALAPAVCELQKEDSSLQKKNSGPP